MLKNFALWFICFGLSFLIESWGWAEQGKAFLIIKLGTIGFIIIVLVVIFLFFLFLVDRLLERIGEPVLTILVYVGETLIIWFATWGVTQLLM